ncbi:extracellular solute-binding protein [Kibdelosporangium phytohabitans]|uniref:extracellular solute-binding protein n=1 Tax=Kibdelosporangium phytohabitans TaxID=860235 RepID=UPI0012FCB680|nr:extracellular solute-binding protein [Kibdelosporangium phytohabitans]MBE1462525.1 cellobiose transport system substrate-binding protein [Kibdelosporangium phytohabitans]
MGHSLRHRLLAALAGSAHIPDMTMLNDDVAGYFEDADQFVDVNTLGADRLEAQYLPWKWQAGTTPDGRLLGFPVDTGPAALYYRHDLFPQAGFPGEPGDVARAVSTWDDYFAFGTGCSRTPWRSNRASTSTGSTGSSAAKRTFSSRGTVR